jgi:hypothetical protein
LQEATPAAQFHDGLLLALNEGKSLGKVGRLTVSVSVMTVGDRRGVGYYDRRLTVSVGHAADSGERDEAPAVPIPSGKAPRDNPASDPTFGHPDGQSGLTDGQPAVI